jgi:hypothetical protein
MGLFDGKIIELGQKLSNGMQERASQLEKEWQGETNPGITLTKKITHNILLELSTIIQNSFNE